MIRQLPVAAGALLLALSAGAQEMLVVQTPAEGASAWRIEAREAPLRSVLFELQEAGVRIVGAPANSDRLLTGNVDGPLPVVLGRLMRSEDYMVRRTDAGYEIRFLSGRAGSAPAEPNRLEPPRQMDTLEARVGRLPPVEAAQNGRAVVALLDEKVAQVAAAKSGVATVQQDRQVEPRSGAGTAAPDEIASLNARAALQLSALVTALQASCPAGQTCK